jgi:uncharacterized damage-inducible protein DinB
MKRLLIPALFLAATTVACAPPAPPPAGDGAIVASVTPRFNDLAGWLVQTAEQVPDSLLGYKPNPAVRSMSELLGHVANAHYAFCSGALGTAEPEHADFEKATDKATLVDGMKASVAYCNTAYQMSDADAMKETQFFGSTMTRLAVLVWNATHDGEHYGNLVVYMRANGMVPPSSQGGS